MRSKWDDRFMDLARHVAKWSKDPSTQVGAVIADPRNHVVSVGYNGFPPGVADDDRLHDRETKYKIILHAEHNAILSAGRSVNGCTVYTWPFSPCAHCASILIQSGIRRVVAPAPSEELKKRWGADLDLASGLFKEAGVEVTLTNPTSHTPRSTCCNGD